jgi:hypothetical protein
MSDNNWKSKNVDTDDGLGIKSSPLTYVFASVFVGISIWTYSNLKYGGIWAILNAAGVGAAYTLMLAVLAAISYSLLRSASEPYRQRRGVRSVFGAISSVLVVVIILDLAFTHGTFAFKPAVRFITSGSFNDTYWACSGEWIFYDEGYGSCED